LSSVALWLPDDIVGTGIKDKGGVGEFFRGRLNLALKKISAGQGVNYAKGVWHHALVALCEVSDFIVIDRGGEGSNCEEVRLLEPVTISEKDLQAAHISTQLTPQT
jgi:hypothetical protein